MRSWMVVAVVAVSSACGFRMGPPSPEEFTFAALDARGSSAQEAAAQISGANADFALVIAESDAAWFEQLAAVTALELSGPALAPAGGMAFVSSLPLLGDTALVLTAGTDTIHVQDALYSVEDERFLDLMLVQIGVGVDLEAATRALLEYMATDVMANAALVLAVAAPDPAAAQQVESMLRAAFATAAECAGVEDVAQRDVRVFLGPMARVRCNDARPIGTAGFVADISVGLR